MGTVEGEHGSGEHPLRAAEDAALSGHAVGGQVACQRLLVDRGVEAGEVAERLELGGEGDALRRLGDEERFDPDSISDEVQAALDRVEQGEGEHADEASEGRLEAPAFDGREHDLGVGPAAPGRGALRRLELLPDGGEVVDLTVEGDDVATRGRRHRLHAGLGEIDDGQAPMPKGHADVRVRPEPIPIGPSMGDGRAHHACLLAFDCRSPEPADPAHVSRLFVWTHRGKGGRRATNAASLVVVGGLRTTPHRGGAR